MGCSCGVMLNLFQHPWGGRLRRMRERSPCIYILASQKRGTLYVGVTSDFAKRLWQHRSGETGGFVSRYGVYRLVHAEFFGAMEHAILREKQLKRWHRAWKIGLIEATNPDWRDIGAAYGIDTGLLHGS